ncbi:sulfur transfer complex subunit TusD, partial [Morganella morganii]
SLKLAAANLADGFSLSGLGTLAEAMMICDRVIQF